MVNSARPSPHESDDAVRAALRKFFLQLERFLLDPASDRVLEDLIRLQIVCLEVLRRERQRRSRSKGYRGLRQHILALCEGPLGTLVAVDPNELATLNTILDGLIASLTPRPRPPKIDATAFVALQKKIFVVPRKRGPKLTALYDEAHRRYHQGEPIKSIAHDLQPEGFHADPDNTEQKFRKAIKRRDPVAAS